MKGCRALDEVEVERVLKSFSGESRLRDRCLFLLGVKSGFRISELLSLRVGDVLQAGNVADRVGVARQYMKQKHEGRCVVLHPVAKAAIAERLAELKAQGRDQAETYLFTSQRGQNKPLGRIGAWCVLKKAYRSQGLTGKTGTHCLRKTFADRVYTKLNFDLVKTSRAMGHRSIQSTMSYLSFKESEIEAAILSI
jgi:integrase